MGTNYYRIPKKEDFKKLRATLADEKAISDFELVRRPIMDTLLADDETYEYTDEEGFKFLVHLGKSSAGWKFLWNFHRNKFYHDKETLLKFIREGRVFDEYGEEQDVEEFIEMALNWCPDGHDSYNPAPYIDFKTGKEVYDYNRYGKPHDTYRDGLRIDTPQPHSTYFS